MDMLGILIGLGLLIWLAFRGWSVLILSPLAALLAAALAGAPLLANWTQTFMSGAGAFVAQFLPLFLLGAVFGKLMDDSGSIRSIAAFVSERRPVDWPLVSVVLLQGIALLLGLATFLRRK